jgi:acetoin utilization protein AcuB
MAGKKKSKEGSTAVAQWMSDTVLAVEASDSIAVARQLMAKHRVNQLPVVENDRVIGIVTDRDVRDAYPSSVMIDRAKAIDRFAETVPVEEVMTHNVLTVRPETALATAVELLRRHRIGALPVVKSGKKLVGIITRSDVLDFVLSGGTVRPPSRPIRISAKAAPARLRRAQNPRKRTRAG